MEPLIKITSKIAALPLDNIDTDQIIPARFLKVTDKKGSGIIYLQIGVMTKQGIRNRTFC
jgi:3-isopropylmalate dehydratase small subunit